MTRQEHPTTTQYVRIVTPSSKTAAPSSLQRSFNHHQQDSPIYTTSRGSFSSSGSNRPVNNSSSVQSANHPNPSNEELFVISQAFYNLKQEYEELQQENELLKSSNHQLQQENQQIKLIMKNQQEAHKNNLRLMLPGEKEIEDLKKKVSELETERDQVLLPKIRNLESNHSDSIKNYKNLKNSNQEYKEQIDVLNQELEMQKRKYQMTISLQEKSNTTLRRKNAKLFSQLMRQQSEVQRVKQYSKTHRVREAKLNEKIDRCSDWNDKMKETIALDRQSLQQNKQKTLRLDSMLKQEWLSANEREELIGRLTEENLFLRHEIYRLKDNQSLVEPPLDAEIEGVFYKNIHDQLSSMTKYLDLKPILGEEWNENGEFRHGSAFFESMNESVRRQQEERAREREKQRENHEYLRQIGALIEE